MELEVASITIGLITTLLFTEMLGLAAGGMIVPGYLALHLHRPGCVALTILAAIVTFGVTKLVARFALVYGRRRIALMLITGFLVGAVFKMTAAGCQSSLVQAGSSVQVTGVIDPVLTVASASGTTVSSALDIVSSIAEGVRTARD